MQPAIKRGDNCKLDRRFISPFLHATKQVLSMMARVDPAAQSPRLSKSSVPLGDVAAVMPMSTSDIRGQLVVSFTKSSLLAISSNMLMDTFTELDTTVMDTAGEITNMITGAAKAKLVDSGYDFDMARPRSYSAQEFSSLELLGGSRVIVPYHTPDGNLFVDLGFVTG